MDIPGEGKMERVLAPEPDILCSIPGTYMVEEEKSLLQVALAYTHTHNK